jgi:hypothetical protein
MSPIDPIGHVQSPVVGWSTRVRAGRVLSARSVSCLLGEWHVSVNHGSHPTPSFLTVHASLCDGMCMICNLPMLDARSLRPSSAATTTGDGTWDGLCLAQRRSSHTCAAPFRRIASAQPETACLARRSTGCTLTWRSTANPSRDHAHRQTQSRQVHAGHQT